MFDSLKSKFKNLFKKAPAEVAETPDNGSQGTDIPSPKPTDVSSQPAVTPSVPATPAETSKQDIRETPVEEKPAEIPKAVPQPAEPKPELTRKEQKKLEKEQKKAQKEDKKNERKETDNDSELLSDGLFAKKIKDESLEELLWELEIALLEADVALPVVEEIKEGVKNNLLGKKFSRDHTLEEVVELSLKDAVKNVLKLNEFDFDSWFSEQKRPVPIMFVGINGTGKTTAIAKIANRLQNQDHTVVLAAGDTFRAGAIEQLTIHADKLGCKIVKHSQDADPAAVAYDAIEHAKAKMKDAVLIDTAGRMQTNNNLIDEMKKIVRVAKPALKVFVGDSLAGNDAVEQARAFDEAIGIDAIILTKIDADSKGGAALSIAHTIGKPIAFVCNGQEYEDIIKFNAQWMLDRLFSD